MLHLQSETSARWLAQVDADLPSILIDHAHCEKKAAGTALNLIFAYVEDIELCREMTVIVNEELEHFHMVLDLLARRGIRFRRLTPSSYGRELNDLVRKQEPQKAVDRLLVAGLIEARGLRTVSRVGGAYQGSRAGGILSVAVRIGSAASHDLHAAGEALRAGSRRDGPARRAGRRGGGDHQPRRGTSAHA